MAERLIKSILWLVAGTGLGYGLLVTVTPNEENLKKKLPGIDKSPDSLNRKQQFVNVLQSASNSSQPLYRLNKESIDKEIRK
ncbi:hypothetical protein TcasGA2_TC031116 [Tribolium castaneum]|uniref:Uncharacterized protein n=1 Tax=Tribolium castaneum TaxID=7070 RepID=A0A139WJQ7_TRICA|nr:hypothetical protein TcasGA2_TC031116 [Tribolium castaneum]